MEYIEELYLTTQFQKALELCKKELIEDIEQHPAHGRSLQIQLHEETQWTTKQKRLLAIYLQCIYELRDGKYELQMANAIVQAYSPLPCQYGMIWIKILIETKQWTQASTLLLQLREHIRMELQGKRSEWLMKQYTEVMDLYLFDILISLGKSIEEIRMEIQTDDILSHSVKQSYISAIEACVTTVSTNSTQHSEIEPTIVSSPPDTSSGGLLFTLGVSTIALIAMVRYREDIKGIWSQLKTSISQKTMYLFEN